MAFPEKTNGFSDKPTVDMDFVKDLQKHLSWAKIFGLYAICAIIYRTSGLVVNHNDIDFSISLIIKTYFGGLIFDFIVLSYISFLPLIYYILVPNSLFTMKSHINFVLGLYLGLIFAIIFVFFLKLSILLNLDLEMMLWVKILISFFISSAIFLLTFRNVRENAKKEVSRTLRFQLSFAPLLICVVSIIFFNKTDIIIQDILLIAKQYGL